MRPSALLKSKSTNMSFSAVQTQLHSQTWQQQLADAFTRIDVLCAFLKINPDELPISTQAAQNFPIKVPLSFAKSMAQGNPHDPLLRQVLPITDELIDTPGYFADPVGDLNAAVLPGLLHKYLGRVLLINTGTCAINCRYCFRRNFPYAEQQLSKQQEQEVLSYLRSHTDISEVILSGGDPLLLSDNRLANLFGQIKTIGPIKRIRIHSRIPIVLPARITETLAKLLGETGKQLVVVVHSNHPNEISRGVIEAALHLKNIGITLLNQSVLLKGVNDDADTLCHLSESLFAAGIMPYYLHQLDKAKGVGHFAVTDQQALVLMTEVKNRLPGYLVPKLVREVAGQKSKQPII
jgi:L-lysine 2,3-aminomutase